MEEPLLHHTEREQPTRTLEDDASCLSKCFFSYLNPLFALGAQKDLSIEDLGVLSARDKSDRLYALFSEHWTNELNNQKNHPSLWNALFKTTGYCQLLIAIFFFLMYAILSFVPVLILSTLVSYFEGNTNLTRMELWLYAGAMFVVPMVSSLLQSQSNVRIVRTALQFRNTLINAIFRKALKLSPDSRQQQSTGKIINMFANDTKQIQYFLYVINNMVVAPIQIALILFLIYREVGTATFAGLGYMVAIAPLNGVILAAISSTRKAKMAQTDLRVKLMNEILNGIRVIKYYAWEGAFKEKVSDIRNVEVRYLKRIAYIVAIGFAILFFSTPVILPIIIFYTYIRLGHDLDASTAFTTIALFNMLLMPFAFLPYGIVQYLQANVSIQRITTFLLSNELQGYLNLKSCDTEDSNVPIKVMNANLRWAQEVSPIAAADSSDAVNEQLLGGVSNPLVEDRDCHTLRNITLEVEKGSLVAIVGAVGSGKSSLLCAILGEMYMGEGGVVDVVGSFAYCDQRPWILNATIENNILFGSPLEQQRFDDAIRVSCLADDLKVMPSGIQTEIGERGINLSGGQKARVALARAVYRDADIYVLDDPLAAVDAHVGQHIFEECICGALRNKTRLLVTHQLHILAECDKIVILEHGSIKACGSYTDLSQSGIDITAYIPSDEGDTATDAPVMPASPSHIPSPKSTPIHSPQHVSRKSTEEVYNPRESFASATSETLEQILSTDAPSSVAEQVDGTVLRERKSERQSTSVDDERTKDLKESGELMTVEELATGSVDSNVYWAYLNAGGLWLAGMVILLMSGVQACSLGANFYLTYWGDVSNDAEDNGSSMSNQRNMKYMEVFAALSIGSVVFLICRGLVLAEIRLRASLTMHRNLLNRVMGAPVAFFDVTPIGRIVNRFSSDMTTIDENISDAISQMSNSVFSCFGALVAIAISTNGVFGVLIIPLSWVYYDIQKLFRKTNTAIARLESVTRSPIYADFSELLSGLTTIRAYQKDHNFVCKLEKAVDINTIPSLLQQQAGYWLGIRLDVMGAFITFFVAFLAASSDTFLSEYIGENFISAGYLALGLNYSFSLTASLKYCIRVAAQLEAQMNSVERVKYYSEHVDQEEDEENEKNDVPYDWPRKGDIKGKCVEMRYRDGPLVLKGLSFDIRDGEKIGVAGRTGSGKSSLMNALFRMQEISSGQIMIDSVDTRTIPLCTLRSKIGIIPQDPVMFSASVRFNLDPFNSHSDEELWDILDSIDLRDHIESLPNKLMEEVAEGGDNFSAGQRQLICIGRALLRRPKILVLDEATASIDNETDSLIQTVVRKIFKHSTVLTIAHRLNTIVDSDRIMVLESGRMCEMGSPQELLDTTDGAFKRLWERHLESHVEN